MKAFINRQFLEQTNFDSGAPSGLAVVLHAFEEPGDYVVTFRRDEQIVERLQLTVMAESPERQQLPNQVDISLEQVQRSLPDRSIRGLEQRFADEVGQRFVVSAKGYATFTMPSGEVNYVVAERTGGDGKSELFDSRRLGPADIFAVTLIRPGTYSLTNDLSGAQGKITVAYPTIGKEPYRPPAPISVECTERGFTPDTIALRPAQGIIFRFSVPSRIKIELVEPNDGPGEARRPRVARWRKRMAKDSADNPKSRSKR